jgi:hypothetical protein
MLMDDLRGRLANRVYLTTDGHKVYLQAVEEAFGADIDYGMLVKLYGAEMVVFLRWISARTIWIVRPRAGSGAH